MSTIEKSRQVSAVDALNSFLASPTKLTVGAAIFMALFVVSPTVLINSTLMGVSASSVSVSGSGLAGVPAWIAFFIFGAVAVSRFVEALLPYRKLLEMAAFGMVAVVVLWALFGGPIAEALQQIRGMQNQMSGLVGGLRLPAGVGMPSQPLASVSIYPHIGALFFVFAPVALFLAKRRDAAT